MNNKILHIILFVISLSLTAFSQSTKEFVKVKASYGVKMYLDKNNTRHKFLMETFPEKANKIETIASEFDFSLVFSDAISLFYLEKKLFSDNRAASLAINHTGYYGRIKQQSKNYITEELQETFGKFLVSRPYQKWELHDETKTIGDYLCFKATTYYTTTNPKGKVFKHDFTAWYAPQLPYKFGPLGYGNLPGLIIELQGENCTYGVTKIKFYSDDERKEYEMPFEKLAAKDEERWRKQD